VILSVDTVLKATGGELFQGEKEISFQRISTDSRTVGKGDLFVALKGDRFDGHLYALEALDKGAEGVLVEEDRVGEIRWNGYRERAVIMVKESLHALGDLARERRRAFRTPVVALTGSNGKTTTKEMIAACLETAFPILKTQGNLNNLIGLPLTLFHLTEKERVVVLEMGMNVPGEVRRLTEIAEPDIGLITNIERVHLEGMGSLERLKQEKGELFRGMRRDGTILVNQDDSRVVDLAKEYPGHKITLGVEHPADVMAKEIRLRGVEGTSFVLVMEGEETEINLRLLGRHFVPNALFAVAVASLFGIEIKKAKEALEACRHVPMRMEIVELGGGKTLINDAYNANPISMERALETLAEVKGKGRAIAVLGDMLELGDYAAEAHQQLGKRVGELSIDLLFTFGEWAPVVSATAVRYGLPMEKTKVVQHHAEAISILQEVMTNGDWALIKGSRGMAMEKIVTGLTEGRS
jgi:UDP-N-acetylmuramoyl-tripeptide--D-alanyl-D-alanine ligase